MNLKFQDNDDVLFDRLVDGELSADERRRMIASLDDRADGWRRCALAFLEAQSWGGAMRQMVRPQESSQDSSRPIQVASGAPPARQASRAGAWLAAAAAVLVAFGLGWQMNGSQDVGDVPLLVDSETPSAVREGAVPQGIAPPKAAAVRLPDADAITLVVNDASGRPQRVQVPLVEGARLGEQFGASPQWAAPEIRRQLAEQGIDLKARRRYAPLYFEQQNGIVPMVVPVDDAVITPVSSAMY
jgi:hypothetical protein